MGMLKQPHPQKVPLPLGTDHMLNTCFRVHAPYGISIGSDVFARLAVVSNSPRDLGDRIASNLTKVSALVL